MRSARLLAVLLILQRTGRSTARTLAGELEVSERTIYRDISMLQAAGVPLWTETGPRGGIRMLDGWRSPVDGFTTPETMALALGSTAASDLGLGAMLAAAQSKLRSALPAQSRETIEQVTTRFHLDASGWFSNDQPSAALTAVADAVWTSQRIDIDYHVGGRIRRRRLDPLGLVLKAGAWYLVAAHRRRPRTYRMARITAVTNTGDDAWRPDGFDLPSWWSASADAFDASMRTLVAHLRLAPAAARALPHVVPGAATRRALAAGRTGPDGWLEINLPLEGVDVAVSQLATLRAVEVVAPAALRAALNAHAARLAQLNS